MSENTEPLCDRISRIAEELEYSASDLRGLPGVSRLRATLPAAVAALRNIADQVLEQGVELDELRAFVGDAKVEWASGVPGFFFTTPFSTEDDMRRHVRKVCERGGNAVLKRRVVGEWQVAEHQPADDAGDPT